MHGVLLLDKPEGLSSNAALVRARRSLGTRKGGHTGTLDPLASGLLVVCLGDATRWAGFGLADRKRYEAVLRLGERTATADREGAVVESRPIPGRPWPLEAVAARFLGVQRQTPPMYSALKRDGRPLYAYARAGETVEVAAREITIHALQLDARAADEIAIDVTCGAGTYVRTLGEDIASALGTVGHLVALRRTAIGATTLEAAVPLDVLEAQTPAERRQRVLPADLLVRSLPAVVLDARAVAALVHGRSAEAGSGEVTASVAFTASAGTPTGTAPEPRLAVGTATSESAGVPTRVARAYTEDGRFVGLVREADGRWHPERLMPTDTLRAASAGSRPTPSPTHASD